MGLIYIDWGYGMGDESFSSYQIGEKIYKKLELMGVPAKMKAETEKEISLEKRVNEIKDSRADILIAIDSNWSENKNQKGIETYYSVMSKTGDLLAKKVQRELIKATGFYSRGIICPGNKTNSRITSLLEANETSIISLIGFYSNPHERLQLEQDSFKELISDGVIKGLKRYMKISIE